MVTQLLKKCHYISPSSKFSVLAIESLSFYFFYFLHFNSLIKFSRRYRSVVRACILDLEEKSGNYIQCLFEDKMKIRYLALPFTTFKFIVHVLDSN